MKKASPPATVTEYLATFPPATRTLLRQLRSIIKNAAPKAEEKISYGMPGYTYRGMLVYFAGYAQHIGFYPGPKAISHFQDRLTKYKTSKGTVQFPLDAPLPASLIRSIVRWRMKENEIKARK
ncbi:MAG: DUF1801 domain-containing protein [Cyclobacteriaceae bacterium]|nr:DUF1801 domain-containing protein [Cyclobacteriaceae bacterium]